MVNNRLKAFTVLNRATQSVQDAVRRDVTRYGLNLNEFAVLELLYHKGEQPIQSLGKKILVASSSITYVADKLEKKGYIRRRPCTDDRRVMYAAITDSGKDFMDAAFPEHEKKIESIFNEWSDEEIEVAINLLKRLGYHVENL
ncbi:MarR family winged helix-turn-helix transcriptional regulator [Lentibacillus sp. CBA3610]|uniref:MarR family winged helix-turn-helix transcriptional regulator n=1 Tax=Lentibacillus sp. CBA3610 TaxID=2518176 RepID=UPI0015962027|nr:MarR family transcriptional regulator [Lentibacillus sp. CBA3610]QKY68728.1 MarR family transcriptional regulator [Lentibacillus sp. CBA3610]